MGYISPPVQYCGRYKVARSVSFVAQFPERFKVRQVVKAKIAGCIVNDYLVKPPVHCDHLSQFFWGQMQQQFSSPLYYDPTGRIMPELR